MLGTALVTGISAGDLGAAAIFNSVDVQPLPDLPKDVKIDSSSAH